MSYPSDLSNDEWGLIEHHFRPKDRRGHASKQIVDAILYVVEGGIKWRMLPKEFPPWQTVYDHFSSWNKRGVWEKALDEVNARGRKKHRAARASYALIDSQSVKTQSASAERGIDGGKRVKGRKRHIVVDILGHLLQVQVHAANLHDTVSACEVLRPPPIGPLDEYQTGRSRAS